MHRRCRGLTARQDFAPSCMKLGRMDAPIKIREFNGHKGYVVHDLNGNGVLDPSDVVVNGGGPSRKVDWNDPRFVAARAQFAKFRSELTSANQKLAAYNAMRSPKQRPLAELRAVVDAIPKPPQGDFTPALIAEAERAEGNGQSLLVESLDVGREQLDRGQRAYNAFKRAVMTDPTNPDAASDFAAAVIAPATHPASILFRLTLGVSWEKEAQLARDRLVGALSAHPENVRAQLHLELLLTAAREHRFGTPALLAGLEEVKTRSAALVAKHPAEAAVQRAKLDGLITRSSRVKAG